MGPPSLFLMPISNRHTVYDYGPGNQQTQRTSKKVYQGLTDQADLFSQANYKYNRQGRLWIAELDTNGDSQVDATIEYNYDDKGIRYSQEVDGQTTLYLYDHRNPTGYAQILHEGIDGDADGMLAASEIERSYALGRDVISQTIRSGADAGIYFLLYDGHGSTRALFAESGEIVPGQSFAYNAHGASISISNAAALTALLFSGERTDSSIGLQYLRARYYDYSAGHFNRLDPFFGFNRRPLSFHKYLYANANPVAFIDPRGLAGFNVGGTLQSIAISGTVGSVGGASSFAALGQSPWKGAYVGGQLGVGLALTKDKSGAIGAGFFSGVLDLVIQLLSAKDHELGSGTFLFQGKLWADVLESFSNGVFDAAVDDWSVARLRGFGAMQDRPITVYGAVDQSFYAFFRAGILNDLEDGRLFNDSLSTEQFAATSIEAITTLFTSRSGLNILKRWRLSVTAKQKLGEFLNSSVYDGLLLWSDEAIAEFAQARADKIIDEFVAAIGQISQKITQNASLDD